MRKWPAEMTDAELYEAFRLAEHEGDVRRQMEISFEAERREEEE